MTNKPLLFLFLLFTVLSIVSCATDEPTVTPTVIAVVEENTAVFTTTPTPTSTPQPPPSATPSKTPTSTPTLQPTPTATSVFSLPSSSIIFVQDNTLKQWLPQTDEIKILSENVYSWATFSNNIALFLREVTLERAFDLIAFHIPTQTETIVTRLQARQLHAPENILYSPPPPPSISVSPDGEWLVYVTDAETTNAPQIFVHKISLDDEQISTILTNSTFEPSTYNLYNLDFTWPRKDHLSWRDAEGIWQTNLVDNPTNATIAIQPSANTTPSLGCLDDVQPCISRTTYVPISWSSDGHYALIIEDGFENGSWAIIEAYSNRVFKFPDSDFYAYSDAFVWLNSTTIIQLNRKRKIQIWHLIPDENPFVTLKQSYQLPAEVGNDFHSPVLMPNGHLRFSASQINGGAANAFYEFKLANGELIKLSPEVPQREAGVSWSPNRQHALSNSYMPEHSNLLFKLNGSQPADLNSFIGSDWCCIYWYEGN